MQIFNLGKTIYTILKNPPVLRLTQALTLILSSATATKLCTKTHLKTPNCVLESKLERNEIRNILKLDKVKRWNTVLITVEKESRRARMTYQFSRIG
ncbi:hypothetical protein QL285_010356 [Trifolium repens]|nr:hypothetical protein QL285_010356 [Trifolium repens]